MFILIVEDEEQLAELLQEELAEAGYDVLGPAATEGEAIQIVASARPIWRWSISI